ncbi:MAG: corrinoid protein [Candidatus Bathyarchaeota archaeon]|nr:corrinoid protein [Candidatus Bathyarchaeota archaeon]
MSEEIFSELRDAVLFFDDEKARALAVKALEMGIDPVMTLEEGLAKPLREVGDRFETGEAFITELIASAQAMEAGAKVLNEEITRRGVNRKSVGKFLIGTVEGDIHSIGKNIVATMLTAAGFEVIDLGTDIPTWTFVEKVKEYEPDILGLSALMTTTMVKQKEILGALRDIGLRSKVKVIVGGAPVTEAWVKEIGADAIGFDAGSAVQVTLRLMEGS